MNRWINWFTYYQHLIYSTHSSQPFAHRIQSVHGQFDGHKAQGINEAAHKSRKLEQDTRTKRRERRVTTRDECTTHTWITTARVAPTGRARAHTSPFASPRWLKLLLFKTIPHVKTHGGVLHVGCVFHAAHRKKKEKKKNMNPTVRPSDHAIDMITDLA